MARERSTRKDTTRKNQPPSHDVKDSLSKKPLEFMTFDPFRRYSPHIPSQSNPDLTYTYSLENLDPNQDPYLNK